MFLCIFFTYYFACFCLFYIFYLLIDIFVTYSTSWYFCQHICMHIFFAYFAYWIIIIDELFCVLCRLCILSILFDIWFTIFCVFIFIITYSSCYSFYLIHILHILHMHKEGVLASGVSFFASAMLIPWSPITGPSCLHTTTDIRHGRPVSYHNLRPESQLILLASGRASFQYRPVMPTRTRWSRPSMEDNIQDLSWFTALVDDGWLAGIHPSCKLSD